MEGNKLMKSKKCPSCGSKKFKQQVEELYERYVDSHGKIVEFEDDLTHDLELENIRCVKCGRNCDDLFKNVELKV